MKNTGFFNLRMVLENPLGLDSQKTAVHSKEILKKALIYSDIMNATADLDVVFAAVARKRKNFPAVSLDTAINKILDYAVSTRIGLLFGTERTGLTSEELCQVNFSFTIPQASPQPSFNLASAVLITLFQLNRQGEKPVPSITSSKPISRREQGECIRLILEKLQEKRFIHPVNKNHVTQMVHNLFGRLAMTPGDRDLLLAIFSKGPDNLNRKS